MRNYDKSILRLLDACKKSLCGIETKSLLFILSDDKNELERLCEALHETANSSFLITRKEIAALLVEVLQNEHEQKVILESKGTDILLVTDFEVIAGKERSQKILYELIRQRFAEGMRTIVFSKRNVFDEDAYMIQMKILFELASKFNIGGTQCL